MPFKESSKEMNRDDFVRKVLTEQGSKSKLCKEFGISRVTGDKWLTRYGNGERLTDRSKEPFHQPNKTPQKTEDLILEVRIAHPAWGPKKILRFLENHGELGLPTRSTIAAILKRNGCVTKDASLAATPFKRFERSQSNELWQTDFKGHFKMGNGMRCHPLTVLDDHSRFSLCVDAKDNERRDGVIQSFEGLFHEFGLPDAILCDNGNPWGSSQISGFTQFDVWMMDLNVLPIHGRPLHPQTQGKEERFHRTLKAELLNVVVIQDLEDAQRHFDRFRNCYNHERPHEALNMGVPAEFYKPSERMKPNQIFDYEYPLGFVTRRIDRQGYVGYCGKKYFLGESFIGNTVGVTKISENYVNICYRNIRIAKIDLAERAIVSKRIYRNEGESQ